MRRASGYMTTFGDVPLQEHDTAQCGHCQQHIPVKAGTASTVYLVQSLVGSQIVTKEEPGAMCLVCMRTVCLKCHDLGRCLPWERMIEQSEARDRWMKAAGIG